MDILEETLNRIAPIDEAEMREELRLIAEAEEELRCNETLHCNEALQLEPNTV